MSIIPESRQAAAPAGVVTRLRRWLAGLLSSIPFQAVCAALIGGVAPALIRENYERVADKLVSYDNSIIGTLLAALIGFMLYRKISVLPGTRTLMRVLPSFLISYALILAIFMMWRFDYSRYQFAASFAMVTTWFALIAIITPRLERWTIALVRSNRSTRMIDISWIRWISVTDPSQIPEDTAVALAADFSDPTLSPEWEATLAREVLNGRTVLNAKPLHESLSGRVQMDHLSENTFGHLSPDNLYAIAKQYIDMAVAAAALIFLLPALLVIGLMVRFDSPGPALFRQQRVGYRGRPFTVYKFRTMRVHANTSLGADITAADDDRITIVGNFLRKSRLDELPQMLNILRGEMSWIGPRPEAMRLSNWYASEIPFYAYRHSVRPGISGWAQVQQGHVTSLTDVKEKLEFDFYYIKYFSVWMDLLIAAKTLKVMLSGQGAK